MTGEPLNRRRVIGLTMIPLGMVVTAVIVRVTWGIVDTQYTAFLTAAGVLVGGVMKVAWEQYCAKWPTN